jgi:hypothetical protein
MADTSAHILWTVQHKGIVFDVLLKGTYNSCKQLLYELRRTSYHIEPHDLNAKRKIKKVIEVEKMIDALEKLDANHRYVVAKRLIKFRPAPPQLVRQNGRFFILDEFSSRETEFYRNFEVAPWKRKAYNNMLGLHD